MEQNTIYRYYSFGFNYCLLKTYALAGRTRVKAIEDLTHFFEALDSFDLQVTKRVAIDLVVILNELEDSDEEGMPPALVTRIQKAVAKLDPALDAELQLRIAYILTKKRHSLPSLTAQPEELLGKATWESLTPTSKRDFTSACMQIALNQPTGAAFHLMRTLEEQVKVLYFAFKKTKRMEKPMWGPMTTELRKKNKPKPSDKLLSHLDGMRIHFRNPTQHPTAFYALNEAEDLLSATIVAIGMICAELPA